MPQQTASSVMEILEDPDTGRAGYLRARAMAFASLAEMGALKAKAEEPAPPPQSAVERKAWAVQTGVALWILGRAEEAADVLKQVESDLDAAYLLGRCLMDCGRPAEAAALLEGAAKNEREAHDLRMAAAEAHRRAGEVTAAKRIVSRMAETHDEDAELHYQSARCLELEGGHEQAIQELQRAVELDPNHAAALFRLGCDCDQRGLDAEALQFYQRCVALRPTFVNALLNLGTLYEEMGEYDRAIECYKRVLAAEPSHPRAKLFLKDAVGSKSMYYDEETERRIDRTNRLLRTPVGDFELSVRSRNCLQKMNIRALGDLVRITEEELLSYKNFGETSLTEIKEMLSSKGLSLGMTLDAGLPLTLAAPPEDTEEAPQDEMLGTPIEELELSVRSRRCMQSLGVQSLGELTDKTEDELLRCKNFGQTSLAEVREKLQAFGLNLMPSGDQNLEPEGESPVENV